jgi:hypothetical protein
MSMWRKAITFAAAAILSAGVASAGSVSAQEATPVPTPVECVAPDLPPGEPTSEEEMMASPEAHDMGDMATEEEAAAEAPVGTAAEGETAETILAAANNVAACISAADWEGVAALMTSNFMMSTFGTENPYDVAMMMDGTVWTDFMAMNPLTYEDGSVSADVQYMQTAYQLASERWMFVEEDGTWKVDSLSFIPPTTDLDTAVVGVSLTETTADDGTMTYAFELSRPAATESPAMIFQVTNNGAEAHELAMVKLPDGADPAGLLDGSIAEADIEFIGVIAPLMPGQQAELTLIGLEPGVYTMVCFFPDAEGVPHIVNGMWAQFEVTAAA